MSLDAARWWRTLLPEAGLRPAVTVRAGGCVIAIRSGEGTVLEWLRRYLRGFWPDGPAPAGSEAGRLAAEVTVVVDQAARYRLCAALGRPGAAEPVATFMAAAGLRAAGPGPAVLAGCPDQRVGYLRDRDRVLVLGDDADAAGLAAVRVVRSAATAWLEGQRWSLVHAAAAARQGAGLAVIGPKGSGKTAAVMALAAFAGWQVIAHDRVFVGSVTGKPSEPSLLPWPSSLNIGLGLLHALGWADILRARYLGGEPVPYHQRDAVTAALLAGTRAPVRADGAELKAQLFPAQVRDWLGVELGSSAVLAAIVLPRIDLSRSRPVASPLAQAAFSEQDVFPAPGKTDYYPDFLRFTGQSPVARGQAALAAVRATAAPVPAYQAVLGNDLAANANLLARLVRGAGW
ncbi:MAG TPA: hypothetical protein VFI65_23645 [Streptosporangiaceae bacterium]|nr:hypothetical protein [Streptosporangiaceae bacterium]